MLNRKKILKKNRSLKKVLKESENNNKQFVSLNSYHNVILYNNS